MVSHLGGVPAAEFILQETFERRVARHIQGLKHIIAASWDIHYPDVGILVYLLHSLSAVNSKDIQDNQCRMIHWEPMLGRLCGEVGH